MSADRWIRWKGLARAEVKAATLGQGAAGSQTQARFVDTVPGCLVRLPGGACLHGARFREAVGRRMRPAFPLRFRRRGGAGRHGQAGTGPGGRESGTPATCFSAPARRG